MAQLWRDAHRRRFWVYLARQFLSAVGLAALALGLSGTLFPDALTGKGTSIVTVVLIGSIGFAVAMAWPREISQTYDRPDITIRVVEGDLFDRSGHIMVGMTTTFDTEQPYIAATSVQAQMLTREYRGDRAALDADLETALATVTPIGEISKAGKTTRYELGTIATLNRGSRRIFCLAYTEMNERNEARATVDDVWQSLDSLWTAACAHANGEILSMPAIGGGQSRLSQVLPLESSIRLTAMSFMLASRRERACNGLDIVVHPDQYARLDRWELKAFLRSLHR
ncbi:MAG: macro domain-containing protein [Actinomycetes bacterium]